MIASAVNAKATKKAAIVKNVKAAIRAAKPDKSQDKALKAVVKKPAPETNTDLSGRLRTSSAESPCWLVWDLADRMKGARRKDVIAAAVAKGVAYYTARTQYQHWFSAGGAKRAK